MKLKYASVLTESSRETGLDGGDQTKKRRGYLARECVPLTYFQPRYFVEQMFTKDITHPPSCNQNNTAFEKNTRQKELCFVNGVTKICDGGWLADALLNLHLHHTFNDLLHRQKHPSSVRVASRGKQQASCWAEGEHLSQPDFDRA